MKAFLLSAAVLIAVDCHAQFTHAFTETARTSHTGYGYYVAVGPDGTVFTTGIYGVLRAYTIDGASFANKGSVDNGFFINDVAVARDGTVFLASAYEGLSAYSHDGDSFTKTAHIDGNFGYVALGPDGRTLFLTHDERLRAFTYDGTSITEKGQVDTGGDPNDVAVGRWGTLVVANGCDGLRAYTFSTRSVFTNTAHTQPTGSDCRDGGGARHLVIGHDGTVLSNWDGGLHAYIYDGTSFDPSFDQMAIFKNCCGRKGTYSVGADGTVFLVIQLMEGGNWKYILRAYAHDGVSFAETAELDLESDSDPGIGIGPDGTVVIASKDGLRAYTYDGASFAETSRFRYGGGATDVALGVDGTVFLEDGPDGLRAYTYDGFAFVETAQVGNRDADGVLAGVSVSPEGTVFFTNSDTLQAYTYHDGSFASAGSLDLGIRDHSGDRDDRIHVVYVAGDGLVFLAKHYAVTQNRLSAYSYDGTSFVETAHVDPGGSVSDMAVSPDGTLFLAMDNGLKSYVYDGTSFTQTGYTSEDMELGLDVVMIGPEGTVFAAGRYLRAYRYDGTSFIEMAHLEVGSPATDLAVSPENTVFLAKTQGINQGAIGGLFTYRYDGDSFTPTGRVEDESFGVAVSPDGTVFVAHGWGGLVAYQYSEIAPTSAQSPGTMSEFKLLQNYPNPFGSVTTITYALPQSGEVTLEVVDILGRQVREIAEGTRQAGTHQISIDATELSPGVYVYSIRSGGFVNARRMLVVK